MPEGDWQESKRCHHHYARSLKRKGRDEPGHDALFLQGRNYACEINLMFM